MGFLSREILLAPTGPRFVEVDIPELGGKVRVKSMTAAERGRFEAYFQNSGTGKNRAERLAKARERLVISSVVDENGNLLFTPADGEALSKQDVTILERICRASQELSLIEDSDLEELAKN